MYIWIIIGLCSLLLLRWLMKKLRIGNYDNRWVFITGCDSGFGNQLARKLDEMGFHVFAACITEKGADELRKVSSAHLTTVSLDVTKEESIDRAERFVRSKLPPGQGLWAVVNNAGITGSIGPTEWLKRHDYELTLSVNLFGMISVTRVLMPLVRMCKGRIVNTASMMGRVAFGNIPYCVSKYGVEAFSDCLRRETYHYGVSVHIIEPGGFKTNMTKPENVDGMYEKTFAQASPEAQEFYGKDYPQRLKETMKMALVTSTSSETHKVVDAYIHAITARFPGSRYMVGLDAIIMCTLVSNLPLWISDPLFASMALTPAALQRH